MPINPDLTSKQIRVPPRKQIRPTRRTALAAATGGEIPSRSALGAAARVLKPGGRLVVGEFFDRHWIPFSRLHRLADGRGLHLTARRGPSLAYLASFQPCDAGGGLSSHRADGTGC